MRFSDMTLQKLPIPEKGQKFYADESLPSFAVRVSQGGTKTFLAVVGKERRYITVGRYPVVKLAQARERARTILAEPQLGIVKKPLPTLQAPKNEYLGRRDGEVRASNRQGDNSLFKHFERLMPRKAAEITPEEIENTHDLVCREHTGRTPKVPLASRSPISTCISSNRTSGMPSSETPGLRSHSGLVRRTRPTSSGNFATSSPSSTCNSCRTTASISAS